jgi:N6-L-threonylcarbamoyladenine synthase
LGHYRLLCATGKYEILSATRDDALGEAYDKVGMLLNINTQSGECMGAAVERIASSGNAEAIDFPIGMTHSADADFSFSGLKTAVRRHIDQHSNTLSVADVAASFQRAALVQVHRRVTKCFDWLARRDQRCLDLVLCGGVACNRAVRAVLQQTCAAANVRLRLVPLRQCADNAVMIAWAGLERWSTGERGVPNVEEFKDRWRIGPKVTVTLPSRRSRNRAHATAVIDSNVKS